MLENLGSEQPASQHLMLMTGQKLVVFNRGTGRGAILGIHPLTSQRLQRSRGPGPGRRPARLRLGPARPSGSPRLRGRRTQADSLAERHSLTANANRTPRPPQAFPGPEPRQPPQRPRPPHRRPARTGPMPCGRRVGAGSPGGLAPQAPRPGPGPPLSGASGLAGQVSAASAPGGPGPPPEVPWNRRAAVTAAAPSRRRRGGRRRAEERGGHRDKRSPSGPERPHAAAAARPLAAAGARGGSDGCPSETHSVSSELSKVPPNCGLGEGESDLKNVSSHLSPGAFCNFHVLP